ncbi:MAG: alpha-hydroxy-acid oxidizing protein [Gemmatimonadetes bacterium]|nr:alpha-hydroxy-acid oxidizing protein [Gemmatimonadota bacterium]
MSDRKVLRRDFLAMLAASPAFAGSLPGEPRLDQAVQGLIAAPDQAINVFDFEAVARKKLPPAHFGYLATGTDDDATLRANRDGYGRYALRVRRIVDVRETDTSVNLFGTRWETPIALAPVSSHRAFHPEGELAVARSKRYLQILSTATTTALERVNEARGEPVWYQLYPTDQWSVTRGLVDRVAAAGCTVMVLTVDLHPGSNRETLARAQRVDPRDCTKCHATDPLRSAIGWYRKPMFQGLEDARKVTRVPALEVSGDDRRRQLGRDLPVPDVVGLHDHRTPVVASAQTARARSMNPSIESARRQRSTQRDCHGVRPPLGATVTVAEEDEFLRPGQVPGRHRVLSEGGDIQRASGGPT